MNLPQNIKPRPTYLNQIRPYIDQPLAKVLTGQRRVGKSYLLYQLMDEIAKAKEKLNIIYINKEDYEFDDIKTGKDLNEFVKQSIQADVFNYVFVDEIQEIEHFEKAIRSLLLRENVDVYITGSNANLLSRELSTLLGGRTLEIEVFSLDFTEFIEFHGLEDSPHAVSQYIQFGGLPYLYHLPLDQPLVIWEYLRNIYSSITYRDIVARHQIRNTHLLEQLIHYLADTTGSLFSAKNISDYLKSQKIKITPGQVQTYIDHLHEAFLVQPARRYDVKGKRLFEFGAKYYFENTGLRNVIAGYRPGDQAKLLETIVHNTLRQRGFTVSVGSLEGKEVDFVATRDQEQLYVQVTLQLQDDKVIEREFGNLLKIRDNYPKWVISTETDYPHTYEGIRHLSFHQFLSQSRQLLA